MPKHVKALLHHTRLVLFRDWVVKQGYVQHPRPELADYEVLRIEEYDPSGNNPHLVFYKRDRSDHITVPKEAEELVFRFLDETRTEVEKRKSSRRRNQRNRAKQREREEMRSGTKVTNAD